MQFLKIQNIPMMQLYINMVIFLSHVEMYKTIL